MLPTLVQFLFVLFILIIFIFLSIIERHFTLRQKKYLIFIGVFLISFLAGIRTIGTDTQNYQHIFEDAPMINNLNLFLRNIFQFNIEPGFLILISIIKNIGGSISLFFFISAFFPLVIVSLVIFKTQKKMQILSFSLFLLLYLFRGPLDIIRQFLAMGFYLFSLYCLSLKKKNSYLAVNLLGTFFHYSNLSTLLTFPFLKSKKWDIINYLIAIIIFFFLGIIIKEQVIDFFMNFSFATSAMSKLSIYLTTTGYNYNNLAHFISRNMMEHFLPLLNIIIAIASLKSKKYFVKKNFHLILLNSLIIGTLIYVFLLGLGATTAAVRMNFLFGVGNFLIMNDFISVIIKKKINIYYLFSITGLLYYNLIIIYYYGYLFN